VEPERVALTERADRLQIVEIPGVDCAGVGDHDRGPAGKRGETLLKRRDVDALAPGKGGHGLQSAAAEADDAQGL